MAEGHQDATERTPALTWPELIEIATAHGYRYAAQTPHEEFMDSELRAQLAEALWKAAQAKRGAPLTEYEGIVVGADELIEWVRMGTVPV